MIYKVQVLQGHTSPDTAYVVDDYPYGYILRCKIRYWIETAAKGAKGGQQRFMSQTTNPKAAGEVWNKPKGSTYAPMAVMYLDENDHVQWWGTSSYGLEPVKDAQMRLMGIHDGLTDTQRAEYDALVSAHQKYYQHESLSDSDPWSRFERQLDMLAEYIRTHDGADPELPNGTYSEPSGRIHWVGDPHIVPVFLTLARERAGVAEPTV